MGLMAGRNTLWWGLALAPIMAGILRDRVRRPARDPSPSRLNVAIAGLLGLAIFAFFPWSFVSSTPGSPGDRVSDAPAGITRELTQVLTQGERIFNAQIWGSWLELAFPENPVFVDSRIEVFPSSVWDDYFKVSAGQEGWQEILDRWHIRVAALSRGQQPELIPVMRRDPDWRIYYSDDDGAIFLRR
jgi:hypothetical protein